MSEQLSTCPECSHTRKKSHDKCLSTNTVTGMYNCHHCGFSGILDEYKIGKHEQEGGKNPRKEQKACVDTVKHITTPQIKPERSPVFQMPDSELTDKLVNHFHERGITRETLLRNRITSNGREILFPYFKDGKLVNIKYKTVDKRFRQEKGAEKILYGLDDISQKKEIIFVEGEIDKLSLEEAGYTNVVSVPDGAPAVNTKSYASKFSYLENCEAYLKDVTKIILAVDNDEPGKKLSEELQRRLGPEKCWTVKWPEGCKDANDVLMQHSGFELEYAIKEAKPVPVEGLFEESDFREAALELFRGKHSKGESTGIFQLDEKYTVRESEISIVTGIPSHGKSEFIDFLMTSLAIQNGWRFGIFSPENYPPERHTTKLAQKFVGKSAQYTHEYRMSEEEYITGLDKVRDHFYFINPPEDDCSVAGIIAKAKVAVLRYGIKGLCIDPWNEIDHTRPSGKSETEHISDCLTKIRRFARQCHVHVWIIAHPAKMAKDHNGNYPVPGPYDISGSAHFRNKADNCLTVWRDTSTKTAEVQIHIHKIRFREIGEQGMVTIRYDATCGRYEDNYKMY